MQTLLSSPFCTLNFDEKMGEKDFDLIKVRKLSLFT